MSSISYTDDGNTSLLSLSPIDSSSSDYQQLQEQQEQQEPHEADFENDIHALEVSAPPKDAKNIVLISLFIIGLACFFPSTAILASNDYYEDVWGNSGKQLVFIAPILIQIFTPLVQTFVTKYQERITYTLRIEGAFISNTLVAILFPIQAKIFPSYISFPIALLIILAIGVANSVLKATLLSLTAAYPPEYTQMLLVGQSASPLAVIILKTSLKYMTPHTDDDEQRQANTQFFALVFFIISAFVTGAAATFYKIARSSMFSKHFFPSFKTRYAKYLEIKRLHKEHKDRIGSQQAGSQLLVNDEALSHISSNDEQSPPPSPEPAKHDILEKEMVDLPLKIRKLDVAKKMMYWGVILGLSCIPPNATYPALLNSMTPRYEWADWMSAQWFHLFMLFVYCFVDIISRAVPLQFMHKIFSLDRIPIIIIIRYGIYILTLIAVYLRTPFISSWITIILTIITSSSQALTYVSLLTQYASPNVLNLSVAEKSVAGSLSAIFIACGVLAGYILSLTVNLLVNAIWTLPK